MRAVAVLTLAAAACAAGRSATENDVAMPVARTAEDDQPARLPDAPPQETAERIIKACMRDLSNGFMVVEVNLQSADNARVRQALAVLDAMATSIERQYEMPLVQRDLEELVSHARSALDDRLKTAPCSLIFAVENTTGRFRRLRGYVPIQAQHSPFQEHRLSLRTMWCGLQAINDKVATCGARYKEGSGAWVDVVVGKDGTVTSAVATGKLANTLVAACVSAAARTATFPPSLGGSFEYPFTPK